MDDDTYYNQLMERASSSDVVEYTWSECIEGFKQADMDMGSAFHRKLDWMNRAADTYFSENRKMAGFLEPFSEDAGISYDYARQLNRIRKGFVGCTTQNFSHDALKELLSAPKDLREDFLSSDEPVKVEQVKQAKEGYNLIKEDPELSDLAEDLGSGRKKPRQAAEEAWKRADEKRKEMEKQPKVYDAHAHARSTEHYDLSTSAVNLVVAMEQMSNKSEMEDVIREVAMCVVQDPLGTKVKALHFMRDVIEELCVEYPEIKTNLKLVN